MILLLIDKLSIFLITNTKTYAVLLCGSSYAHPLI